ncbi:MAG TPA: hypothetical protein VN277_05060 [Acidiferrobacterales bacterium]|nr:hypothetical protein [Acidiferrobacterales bacterium]
MAQVHYAGLRSLDTAAELGRWSVPGLVDWREWDGEFVVRVDSTAQTYLLSALAGEALKAIRGGASYIDEIAARVFSDCMPPSAATAALVATFAEAASDTKSLLAVLSELETLGLAQADLA